MVKIKQNIRKAQKTLDRTITKVFSRPNKAAANKKNAASTANIKVVVRVRPLNKKENKENCRSVVDVVNDKMLVFDPSEEKLSPFFFQSLQKSPNVLNKSRKNMQFCFDRIFSENSTNDEVFRCTTHSLIDYIMEGYNCSVFAYGATGAGKTFTMTGNPTNPGITFLTMTELFRKQEELILLRDFQIDITYLEVYNELVKDLLNPGPPLSIREDPHYGVVAAGIKVFKIKSADDLFRLLEKGNENRTQHPTLANSESSRSHAVFQVYLKMTIKATNEVLTSKLSMIDLAGSERGSATGCVGLRFTEGANINKSLLALGNCINSLADNHRHIPYRDSKLTRLLKDSLGGNCQTIMIANVSPSSLSYDDTHNTLKYASRASSIKASVYKNVSGADMNFLQYVKLAEDLKKENHSLKKELEREKSRNDNLEKEQSRLKVLPKNSRTLEKLNDSLTVEIDAWVQEAYDLLDKKHGLEKKEALSKLKRITRENRELQLGDNIPTPTTLLTSSRMSSIENVRPAIEKAEDRIDEIFRKFDQTETENPHCGLLIENEKLKLDMHRFESRLKLERLFCDILLEEFEKKCDVLEKMSKTLEYCFNVLCGLDRCPQWLKIQYEEIKNLKIRDVDWSSMLGSDSEISSISSEIDEADKTPLKENNNILQLSNSQSKTFIFTVSGSRNQLTPYNLAARSPKPDGKPSGTPKVALKSPMTGMMSRTISIKSPIGMKSSIGVKSPMTSTRSPMLNTKSPMLNIRLAKQDIKTPKSKRIFNLHKVVVINSPKLNKNKKTN